jgi:hypothetical protein
LKLLQKRKCGPGGAYNEGIPGVWKDSSNVRKSAHYASQDFKECAAVQAQYIYDPYGKSLCELSKALLNALHFATSQLQAQSQTIVLSYSCTMKAPPLAAAKGCQKY